MTAVLTIIVHFNFGTNFGNAKLKETIDIGLDQYVRPFKLGSMQTLHDHMLVSPPSLYESAQYQIIIKYWFNK